MLLQVVGPTIAHISIPKGSLPYLCRPHNQCIIIERTPFLLLNTLFVSFCLSLFVCRMVRCGRLFHFASANLLICDRAPVSVDFRGNVVAKHRSLVDWSLTECVSRLHRHGMSWGDIYWLLW